MKKHSTRKWVPGALFFMWIFVVSCGDMLVGPDPENTPENNFEILWNEYDRYYSFFEHKRINWDSLYAVYRPLVSNTTSDRELLDIMSAMLDHLKDGHVALYTPIGTYKYSGWWDVYPIFFSLNMVRTEYLENTLTPSARSNILHGRLSSKIGYIHISSFSSWFGEEEFEAIDKILQSLSYSSSIVVDVRSNQGGNSNNAEIVASRFADQKRLFAYVRYRNGPEHNDFTDLIPFYIEPDGEEQFTKPVVLLTNRKCFSSTEHFVLAMRAFPHVTVIGDTTAGGFGNPIARELPNGWIYRIPRWIELTPEESNLEGIGLAPDIQVQNTEADSLAGKDTILEAAIQFLNEQLGE